MNGVPLLVVAKNLGHADTRMVERHYGHLAPSYIADAIRAGAPKIRVQAGPNSHAAAQGRVGVSEKAEGAGPRTRERDRPARAELWALRAVLRAGRDRARAAALRAVTRELRAAAWRPVRPALRAARAAFRFQTRGASPADLEFYEALLLYSWAMKIATGRSNGGFELLVYLSFLQIVRRPTRSIGG